MRRTSPLFVTLVLALGLPLFGACSLSLNQDKNQCKADADCVVVGASQVCRAGVCEAAAKVDVPTAQVTDGPPVPPPPASSSAPALPCASPAPTCPNNICVPFDNCARLGLCADAVLPPLVAPPKP